MVLVEIEDIVEDFLATTGAVSGTRLLGRVVFGAMLLVNENNSPCCLWAADKPRSSPAPEEESWHRSCGGWYSKTRLVLFKLLCHSDDTAATHPRFVVRNTISICLAFGLGWVGLWNTMPSYSAYPASTIGVIVQLLRQSMPFFRSVYLGYASLAYNRYGHMCLTHVPSEVHVHRSDAICHLEALVRGGAWKGCRGDSTALFGSHLVDIGGFS